MSKIRPWSRQRPRPRRTARVHVRPTGFFCLLCLPFVPSSPLAKPSQTKPNSRPRMLTTESGESAHFTLPLGLSNDLAASLPIPIQFIYPFARLLSLLFPPLTFLTTLCPLSSSLIRVLDVSDSLSHCDKSDTEQILSSQLIDNRQFIFDIVIMFLFCLSFQFYSLHFPFNKT